MSEGLTLIRTLSVLTKRYTKNGKMGGMRQNKITRYKPTKELREATHEATPSDYELLAQAVVSAIVQKRRDVVLKLPYFVRLSEDFPKGVLIKKDETHNWYRAKAFKLADWLHSKGFLPENAKGVVKSMRSVSNLVGEIDRLVAQPQQELLRDDNISVDTQEFSNYNDVSIEEEE
jgi:hypothetical protein